MAENGNILFFFYGRVIVHSLYMCHNFLSQLSVDRHFDCFLAFVNIAAMNTKVHVSFLN